MSALPPVPPVPDLDRYAIYTLAADTLAIDVTFPIYGGQEDVTVTVGGQALGSQSWSLVSKSGTPLAQLPLPITDGQVMFFPVMAAGSVVEVIGTFEPRQITMPTAPGIGRREFNQTVGALMSALREMKRQLGQNVAPVAMHADASGTLANRAGYEGAAAGFVYLQTDDGLGRPVFYVKNSATAGDWSQALIVQVPLSALAHSVITPQDFGAIGDGVADDTAAVTAAVAAALAGKKTLYLSGSYETVSSIPSLHSIRYLGDGRILRSSSPFTPCPLPTDVNILYVATGGNDANDGLSASQPFLTGQAAVNAITNYGASTPGEWVINFAAGTYAGSITFPENLTAGPIRSSNPVGNKIFLIGAPVGGTPNVPTTIFNGTAAPINYGLLLNGGNKVTVEDIKFTNWNATAQTYGIDVADLSYLETFNVHFAACSYGIIGRQSRVYVNGGIVDSCSQSGLTALNGCVISWLGITVSNCAVYGINVGEGSTGHFDGGTIKVCAIGAYVVEHAHVQISGTIQQCTTGVQVLDASYLDAGIVWGTAGLANTLNVLRYAGGIEVNSMSAFTAPLRMAASSVPVSVGTGTTAETVLVASLAALPNGIFENSDRSLTLRVWGAWGGNNGTRTLRLKAGGTTMATLAFTGTTPGAGTGNFDAEFVVDASSSAAQVANSSMRSDIAPNYAAQRNAAGAINFFSGSAVTLSLTGQCSNASDQIVIDRWELWLT